MTKRFYHLSPDERCQTLCDEGLLDAKTHHYLRQGTHEDFQKLADQWIENSLGCFPLPLGIVKDCIINDIPRVLPLAIEESSVIAALNRSNRWLHDQQGTLSAHTDHPAQIGQIHCPYHDNPEQLARIIQARTPSLINEMNQGLLANMHHRGGGLTHITCQRYPNEPHRLTIMLTINPVDAMGANRITQVCEAIKHQLADVMEASLAILSNHMTDGLTTAKLTLPHITPSIGEAIESASRFAEVDLHRATTSNKGIMNAIDAIAIATGNDWRALSAGVYTYSTRVAKTPSLSTWRYQAGTLHGTLTLPLQIGVVGGVTQLHPLAQQALTWMKAHTRRECANVMAGAGLLQNLAALRVLTQEGLIQGHMTQHLSNLFGRLHMPKSMQATLRPILHERLMAKQPITEAIVRTLWKQHDSLHTHDTE